MENYIFYGTILSIIFMDFKGKEYTPQTMINKFAPSLHLNQRLKSLDSTNYTNQLGFNTRIQGINQRLKKV